MLTIGAGDMIDQSPKIKAGVNKDLGKKLLVEIMVRWATSKDDAMNVITKGMQDAIFLAVHSLLDYWVLG